MNSRENNNPNKIEFNRSFVFGVAYGMIALMLAIITSQLMLGKDEDPQGYLSYLACSFIIQLAWMLSTLVVIRVVNRISNMRWRRQQRS